MTRSPLAVTVQVQPAGTHVVESYSTTIAGPCSSSPARSTWRDTTRALAGPPGSCTSTIVSTSACAVAVVGCSSTSGVVRQRAAAAHAQRRDLDVEVLAGVVELPLVLPPERGLEVGRARAPAIGERQGEAAQLADEAEVDHGLEVAVAGLDAVGREQLGDTRLEPLDASPHVVEIGRRERDDVRVGDVVLDATARQPSAEVTPGMRGITTRGICSSRATSAAWRPRRRRRRRA